MKFYGHSSDSPDKDNWQLLREHLTNVGDLAAEKAAAFGSEDLARVAGLLHDLGKYTNEYQKRIAGEGGRVDHSTWGAKIALEQYGPVGHILSYGIAGHHAGLANGRDCGKRKSLSERMKNGLPALNDQWRKEITLPNTLVTPKEFKLSSEFADFQVSFLARMLFSCLVDSDFLDTENYYKSLDLAKAERVTHYPGLDAILEQLDRRLKRFIPSSPIASIRARILNHVRSMAASEPGLFSLNVPTGGGKTLTSLAFALDHAIRHGLRRVIYVIPFTSIVEQTAAVFREALGELGKEAVLEHHSAFVDDPKEARESRDKIKMAMENWEPPIIVTTAVQFFESLFADRPSRCRKLHNIARSVVILDEVQTLPIPLLRPCLATMEELALNYSTSLVLCTATQSALRKEDNFKNGLKNVRELAPDPQGLHRELKRVRLRHLGEKTDEELLEELSQREQVLCIVNNRRHARALFELIAQLPGARHLTTLMCAKHRSEVLAEIRKDLQEGVPCRLVSTSLIEAGVDIDFPTVLRAEAGLDSVAQAAGRCNREGKRPLSESEVLVFKVGSEWATPTELKQFAEAAETIFRRYGEGALELDGIQSFFRELYWKKGGSALDEHDLLGVIRRGKLENIPFETVASKFRMTNSVMVPVIIPYDEAAISALKRLAYAERSGGIARQLQPYLVQIPEKALSALQASEAVQAVQQDRFGLQFMELINLDLYRQQTGLTWDDPFYIDPASTTI